MAPAPARAPRETVPDNNAPHPAAGSGPEAKALVRELAAVADYILRIKQEIGALRVNELCRDRIPTANEELGTVVRATASATHEIMAAAEEILGSDDDSLEGYRAKVEAKMLAIFEACSFQDITGQRISKVAEALGQLERRLGRFASALHVRDSAEAADPEDARRDARREALLINGPAAEGRGIAQGDIDKLFG
ncbi:MAG TPA: chemotaxis protein [Beijerinckiaceae bacterium]|jgi:chemotaxis protein CheZ